MAMLVVALGALIVSGAFLNQSVLARQVENGQAGAQTRWLMAGAVDWVRVILREDGRTSSVDHLAEPWALPLEQVRLNDDDRDPAYLSGKIEDSQARFNLRNLSSSSPSQPGEVDVLARLLAVVGADPLLAEPLAVSVRVALAGSATSLGVLLPGTIDDIALASDEEREAMQRLRPFVTLLPQQTPVNANTAPAEVLAAVFEGLSLGDARRLADSRDRAWFRDKNDLLNREPGLRLANTSRVSVATNYFLIHGLVEFRRARLDELVLLKREGARVDVLWTREAA
jgi:general secretion pathway protein K